MTTVSFRRTSAGTMTKGSLSSRKAESEGTPLPLKVSENASFLIDLKWLSEWEDIKADMNGVYNRVLRCGVWTVNFKDDLWSVLSQKKIPLTWPTEFHLVLNSKRNMTEPTLLSSFLLEKRKQKSRW